jgi:hypothetical protein
LVIENWGDQWQSVDARWLRFRSPVKSMAYKNDKAQGRDQRSNNTLGGEFAELTDIILGVIGKAQDLYVHRDFEPAR